MAATASTIKKESDEHAGAAGPHPKRKAKIITCLRGFGSITATIRDMAMRHATSSHTGIGPAHYAALSRVTEFHMMNIGLSCVCPFNPSNFVKRGAGGYAAAGMSVWETANGKPGAPVGFLTIFDPLDLEKYPYALTDSGLSPDPDAPCSLDETVMLARAFGRSHDVKSFMFGKASHAIAGKGAAGVLDPYRSMVKRFSNKYKPAGYTSMLLLCAYDGRTDPRAESKALKVEAMLHDVFQTTMPEKYDSALSNTQSGSIAGSKGRLVVVYMALAPSETARHVYYNASPPVIRGGVGEAPAAEKKPPPPPPVGTNSDADSDDDDDDDGEDGDTEHQAEEKQQSKQYAAKTGPSALLSLSLREGGGGRHDAKVAVYDPQENAKKLAARLALVATQERVGDAPCSSALRRIKATKLGSYSLSCAWTRLMTAEEVKQTVREQYYSCTPIYVTSGSASFPFSAQIGTETQCSEGRCVRFTKLYAVCPRSESANFKTMRPMYGKQVYCDPLQIQLLFDQKRKIFWLLMENSAQMHRIRPRVSYRDDVEHTIANYYYSDEEEGHRYRGDRAAADDNGNNDDGEDSCDDCAFDDPVK